MAKQGAGKRICRYVREAKQVVTSVGDLLVEVLSVATKVFEAVHKHLEMWLEYLGRTGRQILTIPTLVGLLTYALSGYLISGHLPGIGFSTLENIAWFASGAMGPVLRAR